MNLSGYGWAVVAAFVWCSLADAVFMGWLFHSKYQAHPEVWRAPGAGGGHRVGIAISTLLNLFTVAVYLFSVGFLGLTSLAPALYLAVTMWLAIAVPILVNNGLFIKFHPLLVFSHSIAWLLKLLGCSLAAFYFL
jgi:hypothetical protein